jgi:hypothetical protein
MVLLGPGVIFGFRALLYLTSGYLRDLQLVVHWKAVYDLGKCDKEQDNDHSHRG